MDRSLYKTITVSRGVKYSYYACPAQRGKPTVFFCHGYPSTADDWRHIVPFFKEKGYGIIAPDMLGYGGTDAPTDVEMYRFSKISKDITDILDEEKVEKVVAVGHDW